MQIQLIWTALSALSKLITPERMNRVADKILDIIEDEIANDGTDDWKDRIVLPACRMAREAFDISDDD